MKVYKTFFLLLIVLNLSGCEEVVKVDLEETRPRLVIDAAILVPKTFLPASQTIKLTTTTSFYDDEVPPASGANVSVRDENGEIHLFAETEAGIYTNNTLVPELGETYSLEILYEGETYRAEETFVPVPELQFVEQKDEAGFAGENIELRAFYQDPGGTDNFYLFRFLYSELYIQIYNDEFTDGNLTFAYFTDEDLSSGDEVLFEIQGISRRFYEYMFILRSQAGSGGGPFQTQPTTVRGNIVNTDNPGNFAFGYFRLSETDQLQYTVQ